MYHNSNVIDLSLDLSQVMADKKIMNLEISQLGHIGTHIDVCSSPALPLDSFITKAYVVDVTNIYDREISLTDTNLKELDIRPSQSILFKTNWLKERQYGSKSYFTGHPFFAYEICNYLIEKRVSIIGVDAPGMRRSVEHKMLDEYCIERKVYILENINNLEKIPCNQLFTLCCFPLKLSNVTGVTCRVTAMLD